MPRMAVPQHEPWNVGSIARSLESLCQQDRRILWNRHRQAVPGSDHPAPTRVPFLLLPLRGHFPVPPDDAERVGPDDALVCPADTVVCIRHHRIRSYLRITCDHDGLLVGRSRRLTPIGTPAADGDQAIQAHFCPTPLPAAARTRLDELCVLGNHDCEASTTQERAALLLRLLLYDVRTCLEVERDAAPQPVRALLAWIRQHAAEPIGRNDAARFLGCAPGHVSRLLRRNDQPGFAALLRDQRLLMAEDLLRDTSEPIAAIATTCGFGNADYFSAVFHRQRGATPTNWRERARRP